MKVKLSEQADKDLDAVIAELVADKVASRLFAKDHTLWGKDAEAESSIRLGWVSSAKDVLGMAPEINALHKELLNQGLTRVVLCGMGGSSLAPEVVTKTNGKDLVVLDATDPSQIQDALSGDLTKTVVVVSSKSGSTVETDSQKRIFEQAFENAGIHKTERIFVVTDPGSPMEKAAIADGYRVFNADPTVGGRYSALTAFGVVPSILAGVNMETVLNEAISASEILSVDSEANPGLILGAALARSKSKNGFKDKIGLVPAGTQIQGLADWLEQLIAESTGKNDLGVLPVALESDSFETTTDLDDLLIVKLSNNAKDENAEVAVSGSLGAQFMLWEVATVVASRIIGVNPFDQPDVESAKIAARKMLEEPAASSGYLFSTGNERVNSANLAIDANSTLEQAIKLLLDSAEEDSYFSIHAYLNRNSLGAAVKLRNAVASKANRPVTFGWGPRFLHSTGQYHKGGPKQGIFLQLTLDSDIDIQVPGREFSFQELITSQAQGDARVLADLGRPVLTINTKNPEATIATLLKLLG